MINSSRQASKPELYFTFCVSKAPLNGNERSIKNAYYIINIVQCSVLKSISIRQQENGKLS